MGAVYVKVTTRAKPFVLSLSKHGRRPSPFDRLRVNGEICMTRVKVKLLGPPEHPSPPETIEALVDTGATLSIFPASLLRRLGVKPIQSVRTRLADGRIVRRPVGEVRLKLNGQVRTTQVIFGQASDVMLIGLVTLESLGLTVDPIRHRLVHTEYLMYSLLEHP